MSGGQRIGVGATVHLGGDSKSMGGRSIGGAPGGGRKMGKFNSHHGKIANKGALFLEFRRIVKKNWVIDVLYQNVATVRTNSEMYNFSGKHCVAGLLRGWHGTTILC